MKRHNAGTEKPNAHTVKTLLATAVLKTMLPHAKRNTTNHKQKHKTVMKKHKPTH